MQDEYNGYPIKERKKIGTQKLKIKVGYYTKYKEYSESKHGQIIESVFDGKDDEYNILVYNSKDMIQLTAGIFYKVERKSFGSGGNASFVDTDFFIEVDSKAIFPVRILIQEINEKVSYDSNGRSFSDKQRYIILVERDEK